MNLFLIGLIGLLLIILVGVACCLLLLWSIKDELYIPYQDIDADFPSAGVGE
jgi:hypothetical protein